MRALHAILRGITWLNDRLGRVFSLLLLVMFGLLIAEVAFRYALGAPAVWTNELTQMLFGVYALFAGPYIMAHHGHVNVDVLYSRFSARGKAVIDILTSVLFFIFVGAIVYFGISFAYESISFWERSQSAWDPPIWPIKLAVPVAATLLLLQGVAKLIQDILTALGVEPPQGQSWHDMSGVE